MQMLIKRIFILFTVDIFGPICIEASIIVIQFSTGARCFGKWLLLVFVFVFLYIVFSSLVIAICLKCQAPPTHQPLVPEIRNCGAKLNRVNWRFIWGLFICPVCEAVIGMQHLQGWHLHVWHPQWCVGVEGCEVLERSPWWICWMHHAKCCMLHFKWIFYGRHLQRRWK